MKKRIKLVRNLLGSLLLLSSFGLFAQGVDEQYALNDNRPAALSARPKYVFVFVGDGMSYPQVQSAADFLGKDANGIVDKVKASSNPADSPKPGTLSFSSFPVEEARRHTMRPRSLPIRLLPPRRSSPGIRTTRVPSMSTSRKNPLSDDCRTAPRPETVEDRRRLFGQPQPCHPGRDLCPPGKPQEQLPDRPGTREERLRLLRRRSPYGA